MPRMGYGFNEHGTKFSMHLCDECGVEYTVTPAADDGRFNRCQVAPCPSYSEENDIDLAISKGALALLETPTKGHG